MKRQRRKRTCYFLIFTQKLRPHLDAGFLQFPVFFQCFSCENKVILRASLETSISHGILIFLRKISSFFIDKIRIPWEIGVSKLALIKFCTFCQKFLHSKENLRPDLLTIDSGDEANFM
jgi:hypothetical protein